MDSQNIENNVSQILNDEVTINNEGIDKQAKIIIDKKYINMPLGEALSTQDTYFVTAKEKAKLIIVVGPSESGKTTLETSLYQMFLNGPINQYYFAGSKTLQGYEERAFFTRISSGRTKPDTPRTSNGIQEQFLHIRIYDIEAEAYCNLLFADIAGEDYEDCIANIEEMKKRFPYFKNADFFVVLLDGAQMGNIAKQRSIPENFKLMFRTIVDADLCKKDCVLQIVTSKYDLIDREDENSKDTLTYLSQIQVRLKQYFEQYFARVEFVSIAAMPKVKGKYQCGFGVDTLLNTWCHQNTILSRVEAYKREDFKAEFNKLSYKLLES